MPTKLEALELRLEKAKLTLEKTKELIVKLNADIKAVKSGAPKNKTLKDVVQKVVKFFNDDNMLAEYIEQKFDDAHLLTVRDLNRMLLGQSQLPLVDYTFKNVYMPDTPEYNKLLKDIAKKNENEGSSEFVARPTNFFKASLSFIKLLQARMRKK